MTDRLITLGQRVQTAFPQFYLAGGTAIMLKYQHRLSTDLGFFCEKAFSFNHLLRKAPKLFPLTDPQREEDALSVWVEGIRFSFVFFPFENVAPLEKAAGIWMASDYDLFLNKIYAASWRIEGRDPIDAAFLYGLHGWLPQKVKKDFERKFPGQRYEVALGALLSREDYSGVPQQVWEKLVPLLRAVEGPERR